VGPRGAYRAVLRVREARALIGASAVSQVGDWLYNAVLLGYVYEATGSAAWVGAATIFRLLPYVLLSPLGGVLADRHDKRAVLLTGDLLRCALMLALAAVVAVEGLVAIVVALSALASAARSAERPAALALLPRLVGESRLGPANALLHMVQDLGCVVGPAIGAVLLATTPAYVTFVVNAGSFAGSAALLTGFARARPRPATRPATARSPTSAAACAALGPPTTSCRCCSSSPWWSSRTARRPSSSCSTPPARSRPGRPAMDTCSPRSASAVC
jgi:MFS family permease